MNGFWRILSALLVTAVIVTAGSTDVFASQTYVPLQPLLAVLSADSEWNNAETEVLLVNYDGSTVYFQIDTPSIIVGGEEVVLWHFYTLEAQSAVMLEGRTFIPIKFVNLED